MGATPRLVPGVVSRSSVGDRNGAWLALHDERIVSTNAHWTRRGLSESEASRPPETSARGSGDWPLVDLELPDERRLVDPFHQAVAGEDALDLGGAMDIRAKGRTHHAEPGVYESGAEPANPRVTRVDEAISATRQGCRATDESGHVSIAADNSIKRDKVSRLDLIRERDEVAREGLRAIGVAFSAPIDVVICDCAASCSAKVERRRVSRTVVRFIGN